MKQLKTLRELKELYYKDFPLWAEINLKLLKEKAYELADWGNLLKEIENTARSDLKESISHLAVMLAHLYRWESFRTYTRAVKEKGGRGWIKSIENARLELWALLEKYPSLKSKLPEQMDKAWIDARKELVK